MTDRELRLRARIDKLADERDALTHERDRLASENRRLRMRLGEPATGHGARARYIGGCRCQECKAANARYSREMRRRRKVA